MRTKSTFLAQNALASPTLAEGSNLGKGPRLPMPAQWRQSRLRLAPMKPSHRVDAGSDSPDQVHGSTDRTGGRQ